MPKPKYVPNLDAEWRVVRRLAEAIFECIDTAVEQLADEYDIDLEDEEGVAELADRLHAFAMTGKEPADD